MLTRTILFGLLIAATTFAAPSASAFADSDCGPCNPIFLAMFGKGGDSDPCGETSCNPCDVVSCDTVSCDPCQAAAPCDDAAACGPCDSACGSSTFKLFRGGSRLKVNGWVEAGIIGNSHGADFNGGTFLYAPGTSKFNLNQLWLAVEREMDSSKGFDWGAKLDYLFGMQGPGAQSYGDESFDYNWDTSDDYGSGINQLYGTLGYKKFSINIGKFSTPIGWEGTASWSNFFYSHANSYYIEPTSHTGFLARYAVNDWLTVFGGWTTGHENFSNRYNDNAFLGGVEAQVTEKLKLYYYLSNGRQHDGLMRDGETWRNGSIIDGAPLGDNDYFIQSLVWELQISDKWYYVGYWDLNNSNCENVRWSAYGINNHLIYTINDKWAVGLRFEWFRDNGGPASWLNDTPSDYYEYTLGVNWNPTDHLRIRPEIRYDVAKGATPFGNDRGDQFSGGFGILYGF